MFVNSLDPEAEGSEKSPGFDSQPRCGNVFSYALLCYGYHGVRYNKHYLVKCCPVVLKARRLSDAVSVWTDI